MAALAEEAPVEVEALAAEEVSVAEALVEAVPAEAGRLKYEVRSRRLEVRGEKNKNQDIRIKTNVLALIILVS